MSYMLALGDSLGWEGLLAKNRVVVLAEAGSGKSTEIVEQVRLNEASGRYTFAATLRKVGSRGLSNALGKKASLKLEEWRASDQPAWFFFDSVDEAKVNDVTFEDALQDIAEGIGNAASRAHILLSGRYTDWEPRRDLKQLDKWIAMPPEDRVAPSIDPNELVVSVIRREKPPDPPPAAEAPLVVVMGALSRNQVEIFAGGKGVTDVGEFIGALDKGNRWDFARRPLDLDWLVSYWRANSDLGRLADMLLLSIKERLKESDLQRERKNPLDSNSCLEALERIGAALVLQNLVDIAVPDSSLDFTVRERALDLTDILPDWSGEDRTRLISRAVFDPASAGFARLHNDNQGVVRSFLTAQWLKRLTTANCPKSVVLDFLFATTYGVSLVIPSMRQTAAWLSIWNTDVASEVIRRDPRLLMDAGDPSSLPMATREQALKVIIEQAFCNDGFNNPDQDSLKRFALPDMAPCIRKLWTLHGESAAVRELLLRMIWLGELTSCADLAIAVSFGSHADHYTQVFSGRALMVAASESEKRRYAEYVRDHCRQLLSVLVWDAVEELFPTTLSVDDFIYILKSIDVNDRRDSFGLDHIGPELVDRLDSVAQTERLIAGLFEILGTLPDLSNSKAMANKNEPFLSTFEAAGRRLLTLVSDGDPPSQVIDVALRLGENRHYMRPRYKEVASDFFSLLQATPERRRTMLWLVVKRLNDTGRLKDKLLTDIWQIESLGFSPGLKQEDFDWLLDDAEHREAPNERLIAGNAALMLWRQGESHPDQLTRVEAIGQVHSEIANVIKDWTKPPSDSQKAHEQEVHQIKRLHAVQIAERDQSWRDFANQLRADPEQLRTINPLTEKGVDSRLFNLWELLSSIGSNRSHYAVDDLSPLEPMFGTAVVSALHDAFIAFWRQWTPTLRNERPLDKRNIISSHDCIGIVGVTLEAASRVSWATSLSYDEAVRAAVYATLEFGGFPSWLVHLAKAKPDAVREVLTRTIAPELKITETTDRCLALENISRANVLVSSLLADHLFDHISQNEDIPPQVLGTLLQILSIGYKKTGTLVTLLCDRFFRESNVVQESLYLAVLFELDSGQAISALETKLAILSEENQAALVQQVLPKLFDGRRGNGNFRPGIIPFSILEQLVCIAFRTIRFEDDNDHSVGQDYSPDELDDAESARSALFTVFIKTPGVATFDAIHRLMDNKIISIKRKKNFQNYARDRAECDSEPAPWTSPEVYKFESDSQSVPRNSFDLQRLILRRLSDLQYELLNADYAQGATVARLPKEVDIQNWMADYFRKGQGQSYSIEREPHVAEEKEPDIRFRAKASDANVPLEIKVAESWTLRQLEDALKIQLIGRYLRDLNNRWGIMLLVHQKKRSKGWQAAAGNWLTFDQMITHLRFQARTIAAENPTSPQVEIAFINVSAADSAPVRKRRQNAGSKGKTAGTKTRKSSKKLGS